MTTTTRRSVLASAACLPALAVPAFAEVAIPTSDPVLAAIERHRRLNKDTAHLIENRMSFTGVCRMTPGASLVLRSIPSVTARQSWSRNPTII